MSFSTKLLPMLALVVSMGPFAAQAHAATMSSTSKSWALRRPMLIQHAAGKSFRDA